VQNLKARLVTRFDEKILLDWANDKDVRLNSFNNTEITSESHRLWFQNLLSSNKKICFIFELNEEPFGMVRFEKKSKETVLNYLISKEFRGNGLAEPMLDLSLKKIHKIWGNSEVLAYTIPNNIPSKKSLERSGFILINEQKDRNCFIFKYS